MISLRVLIATVVSVTITAATAQAGPFLDVPALGGASFTGAIVDDSWDDFADGDVTVTIQAFADSGETEGFDNDGDKTLSNDPLKDILGLAGDTPYNRLRNNAVVGTLDSTVTINDTTAGLARVFLILLDVDTKSPTEYEEVTLSSGGNPLGSEQFVGVFDDSDDSVHTSEYFYDATTGVYSLDLSINPNTNHSDYLSVFDVTGLASVNLTANNSGIQYQVAVVPVPEPATGTLIGFLGLLIGARWRWGTKQ